MSTRSNTQYFQMPFSSLSPSSILVPSRSKTSSTILSTIEYLRVSFLWRLCSGLPINWSAQSNAYWHVHVPFSYHIFSRLAFMLLPLTLWGRVSLNLSRHRSNYFLVSLNPGTGPLPTASLRLFARTACTGSFGLKCPWSFSQWSPVLWVPLAGVICFFIEQLQAR